MLAAVRSRELADRLELDVDRLPVCRLCLFDVSIALDRGHEPGIRGALVRFTPLLWDEGLAGPARAAVERAAALGVADAATALADLDDRGPRTPIARAIVRRLAGQLSARARASWEAMMN